MHTALHNNSKCGMAVKLPSEDYWYSTDAKTIHREIRVILAALPVKFARANMLDGLTIKADNL